MKYVHFGLPVCLLLLSGLLTEAYATAWTCRQAELTRKVIVYYPQAPELMPCEVYYAKPDEGVLPRALWKAENQENYCEHKAAEFIEKLRSLGWRCVNEKDHQDE